MATGDLSLFLKRFRYREDSRNFLTGHQMRILDYRNPAGDCEDFAATVSWILADRNWRTWLRMLIAGDFEFWSGTSYRGNGHASLYVPGAGWFCNMVPVWREESPHKMKRRTSPVLVLVRLVPRIVWPILAVFAVGLILYGEGLI